MSVIHKCNRIVIPYSGYLMVGYDGEADNVLYLVDPGKGNVGPPLIQRIQVALQSREATEVIVRWRVSEERPIKSDFDVEQVELPLMGESATGRLFANYTNELGSTKTPYLREQLEVDLLDDSGVNVGRVNLLSKFRREISKWLTLHVQLVGDLGYDPDVPF